MDRLAVHDDTAPPGGTSTNPITGPRAVLLVVTLIMSVLTYSMNATMLSPALPDMARSLHTSVGSVSNVSSVFFLAGAVGGILFTRWSDFIGRRRILFIVLALLIAGTTLCLVAPNLPVLLIGRVLQGASNATFNIAFLIIAERLSQKSFGLAIGAVSAANGGVGGVDAFVGGYLSDHFGFRSIFILILVFGLFTAALSVVVVPKDGAPATRGRMDWWGFAVFSFGLVCLTNAIAAMPTQGSVSVFFALYLSGAVLAFLGFWHIEKSQQSHALFQPRYLRSRHTWPLLATTLLALAGVTSYTVFTVSVLSQDHEIGFGLSATTTGLLFLVPPALVGAACAPLVGWIANRTDWIWTLRIGVFSCLIVLIGLTLFTFDKWIVVALTVATGITQNAIVWTALNGISVLNTPKEAPGILTGLNGAAFGIGAGLGIALVSPFVARGTHAGYTASLVVCLVITALACVASALLRKPDEADAVNAPA